MLTQVALKAWILTNMLTLVPVAPWKNTYDKTADVFAESALESPLFKNEDGRRTASVYVSLAFFEGAFKPDAEGDGDCLATDAKGVCGKKGPAHSFCLFQIHDSNLGWLGVTKEQLLKDIKVCTATANRVIKWSFDLCRSRQFIDWLSPYATGDSVCRGNSKGKHRMQKAMWLFTNSPLPLPF